MRGFAYYLEISNDEATRETYNICSEFIGMAQHVTTIKIISEQLLRYYSVKTSKWMMSQERLKCVPSRKSRNCLDKLVCVEKDSVMR